MLQGGDPSNERGLKVIYDHVGNHIGIEHSWVDNELRADYPGGF